MRRAYRPPAVQRASVDDLLSPRSDSSAAAVLASGHVFRGTAWATYAGSSPTTRGDRESDRDADPSGLRLPAVWEAQGVASAARPEGIAPHLPLANRSRLATIYGPSSVSPSISSHIGHVNDCSRGHALQRNGGSYSCTRCGVLVDSETYLSGYAVTTRTKSHN